MEIRDNFIIGEEETIPIDSIIGCYLHEHKLNKKEARFEVIAKYETSKGEKKTVLWGSDNYLNPDVVITNWGRKLKCLSLRNNQRERTLSIMREIRPLYYND